MAKLAVCISAVLLLLVAYSVTGFSAAYHGPCCVKNYKKAIALQNLRSFTVQNDTEICNIKSIIFSTVKDKLICADPELAWVMRAVEYLKKMKQTRSVAGLPRRSA